MSGFAWLASAAELAAVTAAGFLALAAVVALELRRGERTRRGWRLLATATALLALWLLAAQPATRRASPAGDAILLTPGAGARDLSAATAEGLPVWALPSRPGEPSPPAAAPALPDAGTLARNHPELRRLHVRGHGATTAEWSALPFAATRASEPPPLPPGVSSLSWEPRLPLGAELVVSGTVAGLPPAGGRVVLTGPGIAAAAARVLPGATAFALRALPRGPGRHLLALRLEVTGRAAVEERLAVQVDDPPPPAVLWLEGSPGLESRELARWLPGRGGALAVRSRLAPVATRESFHGIDRRALAPLTAELLAAFDLLILDPDTLAELTAGERRALAAAVREGGLGLLLRLEAGDPLATVGERFASRAVAGEAELQARLAWPDGATAPSLALPPRELVPDAGLVPLAADAAGRLLAGRRRVGRGAVGATLVDGTWRWVRAGAADAHRRYWREVVGTLARPLAPAARWSLAGGPALVGRPLELLLHSPEPAPVAVVHPPDAGPLRPGLRQDLLARTTWRTTYWPRSEGWHRIGDGRGSLWVWVAAADRWPALRLAERQAATAARIASAPAPAHAAAPGTTAPAPLRPLPRWPLFALLLLALALLWGEELARRSPLAPPATAR